MAAAAAVTMDVNARFPVWADGIVITGLHGKRKRAGIDLVGERLGLFPGTHAINDSLSSFDLLLHHRIGNPRIIHIDTDIPAQIVLCGLCKLLRAALVKVKLHLILPGILALHHRAAGNIPALHQHFVVFILKGQLCCLSQLCNGLLGIKVLFIGFPRKPDKDSAFFFPRSLPGPGCFLHPDVPP